VGTPHEHVERSAVITKEDRERLRQLVDGGSYSRGVAYALAGRVAKRMESANGLNVVGEVTGSAIRPYVVSATISRGPTGHIMSLESTCTCPLRFDCKHVIALLLAPGSSAPAPLGSVATVDAAAGADSWQDSVASLLGGAQTAEVPTTELGLLFTLVLSGPAATTGPGISVAPVQMTEQGTWTRKGVSWAEIDELYRRLDGDAVASEPYLIVKELRALGQVSGAYLPTTDEIRLEHIATRGLWNLLEDAAASGVHLLQQVKPPTLLPVASEEAYLTLDITRRGTGLHVEPRVEIHGRPIAIERSLLIGNPAHGIAWWGAGSSGAPALQMAPLAASIDERLRNFLRRAKFDVPEADVKKFLSISVSDLARKVNLGSSDGSVDLPESGPPVVVLTVTVTEDHVARFTWSRGTVGTSWTEPLWHTPFRLLHREEREVLERATEVCLAVPELIDSSSVPRVRPVAQLQGMAAITAMTEILPLLRSIPDLRVDLEGAVPDYREAQEAPIVVVDGSTSPNGDWLDLGISVTVGGEPVPYVDLFTALAEGQSFLVLPSGTYFSLDTPELIALGELITEARALSDVRSATLQVNRYQTGIFDDLVALGVLQGQAAAWEQSLRQLAEVGTGDPVPVPSGIAATLRSYQAEGFTWLAHLYEHRLGGVLGDDMGLGKTLQALALMVHAKDGDPAAGPFLVVAPTSVVGNWALEAKKFAPSLALATITEAKGRRGTTIAEVAEGCDLVITSYALFRIEADQYGEVAWSGAFFDEAQFVKNRSSKGYACAKALPVAFKVAMSGTPIENNLMELWSLLSIAAPGLFPSPERFTEYYRTPIEKHRDRERLEQLQARMRPFLLRRTKEQVADDLPDKQEQVMEIELSPKHRRLYDQYLHRERQKVLGLLDDFSANRFEIFQSLTLLRQAALDISLIDPDVEGVPSSKLDALMDMLSEIVADGHRVLVFSQFTRFLGLARSRLTAEGISSCYLDGSTKNRPAVIEEFRSGAAPAFLISLKAGGFGLNLTEADYCILLDPWWNPATEAQAVDRIHRIGQTRKVMVYRLVAKGTLEDKVMALKAKKAELFNDVFGDGEFTSSAISAADIAALLE